MTARPPLIDPRTQEEVLRALMSRRPGFTPDWLPSAFDPASGVAQVFARYISIFLDGLRQTPDREFLTFLDAAGTSLLPAQPARVPLVFTLLKNATTDPLLPANSALAAIVPPQPPSPLLGKEAPAAAAKAIVFETEQQMTLTRARLTALYSVDPGNDSFADHSQALQSGFTFFEGMNPAEHALYLGHDRFFGLAANAGVPARVTLVFQLGFGSANRTPLEIDWEYLSQDGWLPLTVDTDNKIGDGTLGLTQDGQILLLKSCGPDALESTIGGQKSYWIRGVLRTPMPAAGGQDAPAPPVVDNISTQVSFIKTGLLPDAAATDALTVDFSGTYYPFGRQPQLFTTFYLASKEVFQRVGARVSMDVKLAAEGKPATGTVLTWEYFDGKSWIPLDKFDLFDGTQGFSQDGTILFRCPTDWGMTTIAGTASYWMRVRIDAGGYGEPLKLRVQGTGTSTTITVQESTLKPPAISKLQLQYSYQTATEAVDHCVAFNDMVFEDFTEACRWPRRTFEPFRPMDEQQPAIHFGFDQRLPPGLVGLFVSVPEGPQAGDSQAMPAFVWEYRGADGWTEFGVLDETTGFRRSGMIQFVGQPDEVPYPGLNGSLYRIRARLKVGESPTALPVAGVWTNAAWATQRSQVVGEEIGIADGNPGQSFSFRRGRAPVLEGEVIEIREWAGTGPGWETAILGVPPDDLRYENDPSTGDVSAVWVRWHERPHLFDSQEGDRHYTIERAYGTVRVGGSTPPAGARVIATFTNGGGVEGNVSPGVITELRSAVPYLETVSNPLAASGGAAVEPFTGMRPRGAQRLRHGDRAVSALDIEWLAREASPEVALARCHPVTGPVGRVQRGWFSVTVVPRSDAAQPALTPGLRRRVSDHLLARVPAALAGRFHVIGPRYLPVSVTAAIVPQDPRDAQLVEARVFLRLNRFLHPLLGSPGGLGWQFGQALQLSDIAALLEETEGVDYVVEASLSSNQQLFGDTVEAAPDMLIAAGNHELKLTPGDA